VRCFAREAPVRTKNLVRMGGAVHSINRRLRCYREYK
jgi:hypothetical protein